VCPNLKRAGIAFEVLNRRTKEKRDFVFGFAVGLSIPVKKRLRNNMLFLCCYKCTLNT